MSQQYSRWQDLQKGPSVTRHVAARRAAPARAPVRDRAARSDAHRRERRASTSCAASCTSTSTRRSPRRTIALSAAERAQLVQDVTDDTIGYGPIDRFLHDPGITEVMCNGPKDVYIERRGKIEQTDVEFVDEGHLRRTIDKIVGQVGRRIDEGSPMVDARLPDGSRVNAVVHPVAIGGPFLTIRKFSKDPYTIGDLISFGSITPQVAHFLDACVRGRLNVVVSGGTGTGKTTLLNVLSSFIPNDERIVTIEDAKELKLWQEHVCSMEARPPNIEGVGRDQHPRARAELAAYAARPHHRR